MSDQKAPIPDHTAVRTALWRALHLQLDSKPHILNDDLGLKLAAPEEGWQNRPDMHPEGTKIFRASIVGRARYIDDLVVEEFKNGVRQYVILGAGLDTFAQRKPEVSSNLQIFEVDQPGTQAWKIKRLVETKLGIPKGLHLVPVNFEAGDLWQEKIFAAGFNPKKSAVVASAGVTMYLSRDAVVATLKQMATLAPGSTLAMTYLLPMELADSEELVGRQMAEKGALAAGTPFISFFTSDEMVALAKQAGFKEARAVTAAQLNEKYFFHRTDGLHATKSEETLVAKT